MRVCLVSQDYPPFTGRGGIATQTQNKARALAALGHDVEVLASAGGGAEPGTRVEEQDIVVHRLPAADEEPGGSFAVHSETAYWMGRSWAVLRALSRLGEQRHFDLVDFAEYGAEGFAFQLDRTLANWTPVVVQLHAPLALLSRHVGWPEQGSTFEEVGSYMEGVSIRQADALMACSANIADFTAEHYGVEREQIDVVYSGVDAEAFCPGPRPEGPPTVVYVGNIAPSKGVRTLVDAVLRLRAKHPDLRVLLAGERTALADELEQRAARAGERDAVEFLGFVGRGELPDLYRSGDVFCSPAQHEGGVANVFVEAMACGVPVVASTAGGGPEAIVEGETGLLVEPGDAEAVAAALDSVLSDRRQAMRMGRAGRARVEDLFAMDRYIERVLGVYARATSYSVSERDRRQAEEWAV